MRKFKITVNGNEYEVSVEELTEETKYKAEDIKKSVDSQEKTNK